MKFYYLSCLFLFCCRFFPAQAITGGGKRGGKDYPPHSVLSSGNWYKLAVGKEGIYKIDLAQLSAMGINTSTLSSAGIRLFGSGGQMLPESNAISVYDDIPEVAIQIEDGGDGVMNGADYLLFYAPGPHKWSYQGGSYSHTANLYSDSAYYFLNIGTTPGKRIITSNETPAPAVTVTSFDYRVFYENDSINFLNSGKQWWGTQFSNAAPLRTIPFTLPVAPTSLKIGIRAAGRGLSSSSFALEVNGSTIGNISMGPVSGNLFDAFASITSGSFSANANNASIPVTLRFTAGGSDGRGWLDYLTLQGRAPLQLPVEEPLFFRDGTSIGQNTQFSISNATAGTKIWDLTNPLQPVAIKTTLSGNTVSFAAANTVLHEYVAYTDKGFLQPRYNGMVLNQDLHDINGVNMLIVTTPALLAAAGRLASWHTTHDGLTVKVVSVNDIYNEFASGSPDPSAVRNFVKMCYDKGGLKYLLLFGDASYDYKTRVPSNTNMVPTWQSTISTDPINAYPSDDFFGFLDDADDINDNSRVNLLDVAIGRLPAQTVAQAQTLVDKIIHYHDITNAGRWQQHISFIADDGDNNLHLQDAEDMSAVTTQQWPAGRINKIYFDAYPKVADGGGNRYPAVNTAITEDIYNGSLILNYTGHGNYSRLAEEAVVDESALDNWKNATKLPLFITATCDFAPFDNPAYTSLGEKILLKQDGGGIALMTTTRAVFAASNKVLNANFLQAQLTPREDGKMPTLGEAAMLSKNLTYQTYSDIPNNRKFQLLGDPALTLAFPSYHVVTDTAPDTLKALGQYTITGHIEDEQGNPQTDYNGTIYTTIYDAPALQYTRTDKVAFSHQQNILYRGPQTIRDGKFSCSFVVPADINYQALAPSNISYYASNGVVTAGGVYADLRSGGTAGDAASDDQGPQIRAFLDNEYFKDGDITGENPLLLVHLNDDHGINTTGYGIGHDLVATLDNDPEQYYVLNSFFESATDSYREGTVNFPLYGLSAGMHTLSVKAWDTYNNSSTATIRFKVINGSEMTVRNAGCFPNPFKNQTSFTFVHNLQGQELDITVRIYTIEGKQIKTIYHTINASSGRYVGANWDGTNDAGSIVPPGIYIYGITVKARGKKQILGGKVILL